MKISSLAIMFVLLVGCAELAALGTLQGKVTIGPLCPVERIPPDPACQPTAETYKAWPIEILQDGKRVKEVVPNADGMYSLPLAPGIYNVELQNTQNFAVKKWPSDVNITAGKTTTLNIEIDTGMR